MLWSLLSEIESFMSDSQHEEEVKPRGDKMKENEMLLVDYWPVTNQGLTDDL